MKWDIFCAVVDNLGDAGLCWRLARQLAEERGQEVRLWIDDLSALTPLCSGSIPPGLEIRSWPRTPLTPPEFGAVADVVIEAFACAPPESYLNAMARRIPRPRWINLEYLSAEAWVDDCHLLPSPHPSLPLEKTFFFPGFTPKTGGLPRERDLPERQRRFLSRAGRSDLFAALGLDGYCSEDPNLLVISLFCYDNPPIRALIDAWRRDSAPILVLVPPGKPRQALEAALKTRNSDAGILFASENLCLAAIPFLPQTTYDELLWACDFNFVRGEDSFVRAQWAGHPFVWQAYPQTGNTHANKLNAFLERFAAISPAPEDALLRDFSRAWNGLPGERPISRLWPDFRRALPALERQALRWRDHLAKQEDLASALVRFCQSEV